LPEPLSDNLSSSPSLRPPAAAPVIYQFVKCVAKQLLMLSFSPLSLSFSLGASTSLVIIGSTHPLGLALGPPLRSGPLGTALSL
jgi:hypothetical protein